MQALFKVIKGNQIELEILLASFYGLRRSEVLGLRWSNIDFDSDSISISHTVVHVQVDGAREIVAANI